MLPGKRLADAPCVVRKLFHIAQLEFARLIVSEEEPVAAPGDVPFDRPDALHVSDEVFLGAVAGNVSYGYFARFMQLDADIAARRFNRMTARPNAAEMGKSRA